MLEGTPWFKTLPGGARWLCFQLVKLMATPSYAGAIPFADARRVSLLVSMEVSEVETQLETLVESGLLARDEKGRLSCPSLGAVAARAAVARHNGSHGGRPRKGETAEQMHQRRQREMLYPIAGGTPEKPSETQRWETASAGAAPRTTSSSSLKSETTQSVARDGDWQQVARRIVAELGLSSPRIVWTPVRDWMAAGATPEIIMRAVHRQAGEKGFDPAKVFSLNFFRNEVKAEIGAAASGGSGTAAAFYGHEETDLDRQHRAWAESGYRGPPPRLARSQQHAA
ncbi:hypothetical protein [Roseococcus pinisoli]|uniref:Uncharacterized protein n=1 Tax=Roseococcus pinisoli TaxID=2835040 RepID=A0ABS5QAI7_9PROT|nr:hypothetical protein [Roseococcus pinisoli]MBS7810523.1 hypothetical protein [Roseococcus pinisoli]